MADDSKHQDELKLSDCEREQIHIPGSVQPHGLFFALDPADLSIVQVSENIESVYGVAVDQVIGSPLADLVEVSQQERLRETLDALSRHFSNPLRVPLVLGGRRVVFDGITHETGGTIVLELENPNDAEVSDAPGSRSVDAYFQLVSRSLSQVPDCPDIAHLGELMASELRDFTGFDRVMIYQFAPDFHGEVIAEARRDDLEPFLGLHYPATDIPKQARELYKRNWIRLLRDVGDAPVPIIPAENRLTGGSTDLSLSVLRSISPIHIQYLKNMGVAATMTISLMAGDELWGLIACHHYSSAKFVTYSERSACVLYGVVMSAQISAKERRLAVEAENETRGRLTSWLKSLSGMKSFDSVSERLDLLMALVDADGAASVHGERIELTGLTPEEKQIPALMEASKPHLEHGVWITDQLGTACPETKDLSATAAGMITFEVSEDWRLFFFRGEQAQEVRWGGDPNKAVDAQSPLTPRHSFAEWRQVVEGRSLPWRPAIKEVIAELRGSLSFFVIERNKELERVNAELADRNIEVEQLVYSVSHDLKSPLVTCNGYLDVLREDLADGDYETANDSIGRISRAAKKMGHLIDDLLTFSKVGRHGGVMETVDVDNLLGQVEENYDLRLSKKNVTLTLHPPFPHVHGHARDLTRLFENLLDNALKYGCGSEAPRVEIGCQPDGSKNHFYVRDNGDGIEPRFHETIFQLFKRVSPDSEGTGVGLASVSKIVGQHGGRIWVESEPGAGATFWLAFPKTDKPTAKTS